MFLSSTKKISIIIPFYNPGEYIRKCLSSVLNQTYSNLEIILVNNNSNDISVSIVNEYIKNSPKISMVHAIEKKGASYARNCGIKVATGDYIMFIDSDDYIDSNYIEKCVQRINECGADIVVGARYRNNQFNDYTSIFKFDDNYDSFSLYAFRTCTGCLFSYEIVKTFRIYFDESIVIGEDTLFYTEVLLRAKKIYLTYLDPFYYKVERTGSVYNSQTFANSYTNIVAHKKIYSLMKNAGYKKACKSAKKYFIYKCYDLIKTIKKIHNFSTAKIKVKLKIRMFINLFFVAFNFNFKFFARFCFYLLF